jgi:hypothetical protein
MTMPIILVVRHLGSEGKETPAIRYNVYTGSTDLDVDKSSINGPKA